MQGNFQAAIREFDLAILLAPDYLDAQVNAARALREWGHFDAAVERLHRILDKWPSASGALLELAYLASLRGELDSQISFYQAALRQVPGDAVAHWNLGLALLAEGRFDEGWEEFEWRFRCPDYAAYAFDGGTIPCWQGQSIDGKTVLLVCEQGLGDSIQFVRYAESLKRLNATVIVRSAKSMERLLQSCPWVDATISNDQPVPHADFWISLLSLPQRFGTTLKNVPSYDAYLFADHCLSEKWALRLAAEESKSAPIAVRIGVAWRGSARNPRDKQRSFAADVLLPIAQVPGTQLFSLQKGIEGEQLAISDIPLPMVDLGPELDLAGNAFWDTAAVIQQLDLVIACDSAVAHLAGALGVPVWLALPKYPDWRWMRERSDTPWYPQTRLFRQSQEDRWSDVFAAMAARLRAQI